MTSGYSLTELLVQYLYKNRYLSLPKLGRFNVSDEIDLSQPEHVEFSRIPEGVITFTANAGEETDVDLVRYITGHTRKMQSLAIADLFTLTDQARQMLNILQPVSFSGIGALKKDTKGKISFTPGTYRGDLLRNDKKKPTRAGHPKRSSAAVTVPSKTHFFNSIGGFFIIIICIIVAVGLVYFMFSHRKNNEEKMHEVVVADSSSHLSDTVGSEVMDNNLDSPKEKESNREGLIHYEVVFQRTDSIHAFWRYDQLTGWGHKIIMYTSDSVHYSLSVPITSMASDTTKIKDSLRIFFGHPTTIRYNTER